MKHMNAEKILKALCASLVLLVSPVALAEEVEAEQAYADHAVGGFIGVTGSGRRDNGLTLALKI